MFNFVDRRKLFNLTVGRSRFDPSILGGLVLHFDFSDKNTLQLDTNNRVLSVSETQFSGIRQAQQINATNNRPTYIEQLINNRAALSFNGNADFLNLAPTLTLNGEYTIFIVAASRNNTELRGLLSTTGGFPTVYQQTDLEFLGSDFGATFQTVNWPNYNQLSNIVLQRDAGDIVYGQTTQTNYTVLNNSNPITGTLTTEYIGGNFGSNPTYETWYGAIGEIIIYDKFLDQGQLKKINDYLYFKWGIAQ